MRAATEAPDARRAMGLDNDSDEEALAEMPTEDPKRARGVNNKAVPRADLTTISFRGMEMTLKVRGKGRGIAVPLEGGESVDHPEAPARAGACWRSPCGGSEEHVPTGCAGLQGRRRCRSSAMDVP